MIVTVGVLGAWHPWVSMPIKVYVNLSVETELMLPAAATSETPPEKNLMLQLPCPAPIPP